jgi:hypothetical protein
MKTASGERERERMCVCERAVIAYTVSSLFWYYRKEAIISKTKRSVLLHLFCMGSSGILKSGSYSGYERGICIVGIW